MTKKQFKENVMRSSLIELYHLWGSIFSYKAASYLLYIKNYKKEDFIKALKKNDIIYWNIEEFIDINPSIYNKGALYREKEVK